MNDVVDITSSSPEQLIRAEDVEVIVASDEHIKYVDEILDTINRAAKVRGTGIAKRSPEYVSQKMHERKAVIALGKEGEFAGFSYIESWGNKQFVANSGLIVANKFRGIGLATRIKRRIFQLSRERFPEAKIFSLTTGAAVMKMNSELGYRPVTFDQLTDDAAFWKGCESCVNYDILQRNGGHKCLCVGLLYDPADEKFHQDNRLNGNDEAQPANQSQQVPDGKLIEELEQLLATWKKGK